uniref:Uncharacterized protein n=1 Tax=Arundo donax TaxID=35708 RepID=A0A0A9BPL4_ARUDO
MFAKQFAIRAGTCDKFLVNHRNTDIWHLPWKMICGRSLSVSSSNPTCYFSSMH